MGSLVKVRQNKATVPPRAIPMRTQESIVSEHDIQVALFEWAAWAQGVIPELAMMFAIPNQGVGRNKRLQMEGAQAGIPDIFLAVPRWCKHGLFIELKRGKAGQLSKRQLEWGERLAAQGYAWECCYSFNEAKDKIMDYIEHE